MEKLRYRLLVIFILVLCGLYITIPWKNFGFQLPFTGTDYKLGLDLQGGVELDYKIDLDEVRQEEDYTQERETSIIEGLKSIVDRRVEALKISDSQISTASYGSEKHIIVQIPLKGTNKEENELNIKRAKEAIGKVMKIEFKELRTSVTEDDLAERLEIAQNLLDEAKESKYAFNVTTSKYKDSYENVEVGTLTGSLDELGAYFTTDNLIDGYQENILTGSGTDLSTSGYWILENNGETEGVYNIDYAFVNSQPSEWMAASDSEGRILSDEYFTKASVQTNQSYQPMVELTFNSEGAEIFGELTKRLKGSPIAIFVGGELLTAPRVNDVILTGKAVITGSYTFDEANQLANDINTGVVPAPIYLTSEKSIDSRLGLNSLTKLLISGLVGFALIVVFLVAFYRISGVAASLALFVYCLVTLLLIKLFSVVLTLASIAGLILSIGMAIDANILIFERIKDELRKGTKLEKAVKEGFDKSWTAIWDSNITGIIISLILYIFGINMIKGFGLTLGIGLVTSLFSAMFVSRLFILLIIKKQDINLKCFIGHKK